MVNRGAGGILGPMSQVFHEGTVAGLTDAQLLERYATLGDDAAFEALLTRYGPMVLGVCRRRLRDGHAAEDAFQATFLVLVRKASSIRVDPIDRPVDSRGRLAGRRAGPGRIGPASGPRSHRPGHRTVRGSARSRVVPPRAGRGLRRGTPTAPREVPRARRALPPGRAHARGSLAAAGLSGGDGEHSADASPRPTEGPPRSTGLLADGPGDGQGDVLGKPGRRRLGCPDRAVR